MAPHRSTYFDYYQSEDKDAKPLSVGGDLPLLKVYNYEPIPSGLTPDEEKLVLGGQGHSWTEYMPNSAHIEYMAFPRACALSEVLWSKPENHDYDDFLLRLQLLLRLLDRLNVNYRPIGP